MAAEAHNKNQGLLNIFMGIENIINLIIPFVTVNKRYNSLEHYDLF